MISTNIKFMLWSPEMEIGLRGSLRPGSIRCGRPPRGTRRSTWRRRGPWSGMKDCEPFRRRRRISPGTPRRPPGVSRTTASGGPIGTLSARNLLKNPEAGRGRLSRFGAGLIWRRLRLRWSGGGEACGSATPLLDPCPGIAGMTPMGVAPEPAVTAAVTPLDGRAPLLGRALPASPRTTASGVALARKNRRKGLKKLIPRPEVRPLAPRPRKRLCGAAQREDARPRAAGRRPPGARPAPAPREQPPRALHSPATPKPPSSRGAKRRGDPGGAAKVCRMPGLAALQRRRRRPLDRRVALRAPREDGGKRHRPASASTTARHSQGAPWLGRCTCPEKPPQRSEKIDSAPENPPPRAPSTQAPLRRRPTGGRPSPGGGTPPSRGAPCPGPSRTTAPGVALARNTQAAVLARSEATWRSRGRGQGLPYAGPRRASTSAQAAPGSPRRPSGSSRGRREASSPRLGVDDRPSFPRRAKAWALHLPGKTAAKV